MGTAVFSPETPSFLRERSETSRIQEAFLRVDAKEGRIRSGCPLFLVITMPFAFARTLCDLSW